MISLLRFIRYILPSMTMTDQKSLVARGKVIRVDGQIVVFQPSGTTYELHLERAPGSTLPPIGVPTTGRVVVRARKVYTVPSGGNFISPIFGPPRIVQGRVRAADEKSIVLQAGTLIHVELPSEADAIDLANGPLTVGELANVVCLPGASWESA